MKSLQDLKDPQFQPTGCYAGCAIFALLLIGTVFTSAGSILMFGAIVAFRDFIADWLNAQQPDPAALLLGIGFLFLACLCLIGLGLPALRNAYRLFNQI